MKISGIMILMEEHQAYYYFANSKQPTALKVGDKYYCGIGRPWDGYLEDSAPLAIRSLAADAEEIYHLSLAEPVYTSISDALSVLKYINSVDKDYRYELAAINSKQLDKVTGGIEVASEKWSLLGIDICSDSCLPIKEELFAAQVVRKICLFPRHFVNLNNFGLFDSELDAADFIRDYLSYDSKQKLEPINNDTVEFRTMYRYSC